MSPKVFAKRVFVISGASTAPSTAPPDLTLDAGTTAGASWAVNMAGQTLVITPFTPAVVGSINTSSPDFVAAPFQPAVGGSVEAAFSLGTFASTVDSSFGSADSAMQSFVASPMQPTVVGALDAQAQTFSAAPMQPAVEGAVNAAIQAIEAPVFAPAAFGMGTALQSFVATPTLTTKVGTANAALEAEFQVVVQRKASTWTILQNWTTGTPNNDDWANVGNALVDDGSNATVSSTAGLSADGFNDMIKFKTFSWGANPPASSWTRTKAEVVLDYAYDLTFTHILGVDHIRILLTKSSGAVVSTLRDQTNVNGTRAMATTRYDVTAAVAALTTAEIDGLQVWFGLQAQVPIAGGNASGTIDFVRMDHTYASTGF